MDVAKNRYSHLCDHCYDSSDSECSTIGELKSLNKSVSATKKSPTPTVTAGVTSKSVSKPKVVSSNLSRNISKSMDTGLHNSGYKNIYIF